MLQSFTRNYEDKSNENGFQFIFKCDVCGDGYESSFVGSNAQKRKGFFNKVSQFGGAVTSNAYLAGGSRRFGVPDAGVEQGTRSRLPAGVQRCDVSLP